MSNAMTPIQGVPGLVGINESMRLFVVPCGDDFYSSVGFDVAARETDKVARWLRRPDLQAFEVGTVKAFERYRDAMAAGAAHNVMTGERCPADLIPELIGHEGKQAEIVEADGERRRFRIGKSTGWLPVHLEITGRAKGGDPIYLPEGATIRVIG